ncbi:high mobility group B protein 13-like [Glycine max]|uniref:high mobility group B protein 13-like n=1 Tax=Glycine max TaxID=3847 RepID=UPI001B357472|nr:high mobility group B protein 13-like [Glycine max]
MAYRDVSSSFEELNVACPDNSSKVAFNEARLPAYPKTSTILLLFSESSRLSPSSSNSNSLSVSEVAETAHLLWNNEHILNLIMQNRQKIVTAEEKMPYEGIYHAGKEAYLQVIAMEKRETDSMRFLEDEQKQRTAMELFEQKEKDPLKPKHPMSAYLLFTNDRRAALAAENNNLLEVIACHPCL